MAAIQDDIQALQKQLDEATDYDERSALRKKIRELKKAAGQAVGSVRRGDAAYRRPGTGMKGPSNKPVYASTVHHGGSYLPPSAPPAKVSAADASKRSLSPAMDSAKQEAVSPSSSLPSSRKSSQSVESKDSLTRPQAGGSRDQTASPVEPLDVSDRRSNDRDTPVDRDLSVEQVQPDVEETDLGEEVVQQREEERQEEEEAAPSPVEQVEVEHSHELEAKQDEPEDEQAEPEDTPEITPAEPEEVEEEEIAEEPSAVQEHEPYQEEEQEEYPPADEAETHEAAEEEPESKKTEPEPEKKELGARRRMQPQGEVRKDKKGPEQVDFRNVLRKTENPATVIASSTFYKSGSKQDSDEPRTESPVHKPSPQPFQVNGAEDVDSVVEAYEARREARRKAREARRKSTDEKKSRDDSEKMTYREKREQELKKQASQSGTPQQQQSAPPRPMQRQTSNSNPTKQLLQWAQHKTRFYDDVNVTDFTHSFKDGLALAAIMHCYVPECVPIEELSVHTPRRNFEVAFAAAKEAGIPEMLDADDFLSVTVPDAQSVMTYLVTIYQHFN